VLRLDAEATARLLNEVLEKLRRPAPQPARYFRSRASEMEDALEPHAQLNKTQRGLIGAYFLNEYSFEASALFNPSIVRHPDQTGRPETRLPIHPQSSRVGEGHVSSLTFRSGTIAWMAACLSIARLVSRRCQAFEAGPPRPMATTLRWRSGRIRN